VATAQWRRSTWKVRKGWELTETTVRGSVVRRRGNEGEEVRHEVGGAVRVVKEVCGTPVVLEGLTAGPDDDWRRWSTAGCSVVEGRARRWGPLSHSSAWISQRRHHPRWQRWGAREWRLVRGGVALPGDSATVQWQRRTGEQSGGFVKKEKGKWPHHCVLAEDKGRMGLGHMGARGLWRNRGGDIGFGSSGNLSRRAARWALDHWRPGHAWSGFGRGHGPVQLQGMPAWLERARLFKLAGPGKLFQKIPKIFQISS
jgi:hypothetical protein